MVLLNPMERHNPWWYGEIDETYEQWRTSDVKWLPELIENIKLKPFSLHFITGPRQVGKTTAVKILANQLAEATGAKSVFYCSCDELQSHSELGEILDNYINSRKAWGVKASTIILDEITYVDEWWRAIKARIDAGVFKRDNVIITGSASIEILKRREMFPGRRGHGKDHVMLPLDFSRFAGVVDGLEVKCGGIPDLEKNVKGNGLFRKKLDTLLENYLEVGGFPASVKDFARYGKVSIETSKTYLDWLRGDWTKSGKSDRYMREIISYLIRAAGTTISWNSISSQTSINSPHTVQSYAEVLEGMYAIITLNHLSADRRIEHRKNKKIHFTDPLLYKVMGNYTRQEVSKDWILEGTVASHLARHAPVYYWRNHTEVDAVCLDGKRQIGFEVSRGLKKWKAPWHLDNAHILDRRNASVHLASLHTGSPTG
jgi:predicted AAA+ superfamily ATPase